MKLFLCFGFYDVNQFQHFTVNVNTTYNDLNADDR